MTAADPLRPSSGQVCAHFLNADGHAVCLIGRNPTLDGCGRGCPAYLPDSERQPCEVWTRVMGYHRPVSAFNRGKQAEHAERRLFVETGHCPVSTGGADG